MATINMNVTNDAQGTYNPRAVYDANTKMYTRKPLKIMWDGPGPSERSDDITIEIYLADGGYPIVYTIDSLSSYFEWYPFEDLETIKSIIENQYDHWIKVVVSVPVNGGDIYQGYTTLATNMLKYSSYADDHYSPQRVPYTFDCPYVTDSEKTDSRWNYYVIFSRKTSDRYKNEIIPNGNIPELIWCGTSSNEYIRFDHVSAKVLYDSGIKSGDKIYFYVVRAFSNGFILDVAKRATTSGDTRVEIDYYDIPDSSNKQLVMDNGDTSLSVEFNAPATSEKIVRYLIDGEEYASYRKGSIFNGDSTNQNEHVTATLEIPYENILKKNHNSNAVSVLEITIKYSSGSYMPGVHGDNTGLIMSSYINVGLAASKRSTFRIMKAGKDIRFDLNGSFVVFNNSFNTDYIANKIAIIQYRNGDSKQLSFNSIKKVQFTDASNRLFEGDSVTIDTDTATISVNGGVRHELGDISNDYDAFFLKPGENIITCTYSDWVESPPTLKLKYREVFL